MSNFLNKLKRQKNVYKKGKKKKVGGGLLPPGIYLARLSNVEGTVSSTDKPMVKWTWVVVEGEEKGQTGYSNSVLVTEDNYAYFNRDLTRLGYELPDDMGELEELLSEIAGEKFLCKIRVVERDGNTNIYLQSVIEDDGYDDDEADDEEYEDEDEYEEEEDDEEEEEDEDDDDEEVDDDDEEDEEEDDEYEDEDEEEEDDEEDDEEEEDEEEVDVGDPVSFEYKEKEYVGVIEKLREENDGTTLIGVRVVGRKRLMFVDPEDASVATKKELDAYNKANAPAEEQPTASKKKKKTTKKKTAKKKTTKRRTRK